MLKGSSKSLKALRLSSAARYCQPVAIVTHNFSDSASKNRNSVIPTIPEVHYKPEQISIDAAAQALYAKLPRGEAWDRQPEDLRLMNGTDKESIVRFRCCLICSIGIPNAYSH